MGVLPNQPLPLSPYYQDPEPFVKDLLHFVTTSSVLHRLTSQVHILDFFTRTPDLYEWAVGPEWRAWFDLHPLEDLMELFFRADLAQFSPSDTASENSGSNGTFTERPSTCAFLNDDPPPPLSLIYYLHSIRSLSLSRDPRPDLPSAEKLPFHVAVGMNVKKVHEVARFAGYIENLAAELETQGRPVSHVVDFGAGQNYLGRALASKPYSRNVIAVEGKGGNVEGARRLDVLGKIAPKTLVRRDLKAFKASRREERRQKEVQALKQESDAQDSTNEQWYERAFSAYSAADDTIPEQNTAPASAKQQYHSPKPDVAIDEVIGTRLERPDDSFGTVQHVAHHLASGDLSSVTQSFSPTGLLTVSIHSCGNLSHHGLRSLTLNPEVSGVAIIGCCYNLVTERLTPPSYKHPQLRPADASKDRSGDPQGFPISERMANFGEKGVHFNITARMMAVQAPLNWTPADCENFFTRHFFRALLQRVFVDRGVVQKPFENDADYDSEARSAAGSGGASQPVVVGSLRKSAFSDFVTYSRAAFERIGKGQDENGQKVRVLNEEITDEELREYESRFQSRKKDLSIVWSLMAYSAGLVEVAVVVDRWLWLKEQKEVSEAWVEPVWDYRESPRNLVVVGLKK